MKKLNLVHRGKCRGFFVNFLRHFPWKLKDENLRKISPKFRRIFRRSLRKISQELRSGGLRPQNWVGLSVHFANVHFCFWAQWVPLWGLRARVVFELATSLEGFFCHQPRERVPGAPLKGIKRYEGHSPGLKSKVVMSKVVSSGLLTQWKKKKQR